MNNVLQVTFCSKLEHIILFYAKYTIPILLYNEHIECFKQHIKLILFKHIEFKPQFRYIR